MVAWALVGAFVAAWLGACARRPAVAMTVLIEGEPRDAGAAARALAATAVPGLVLRLATLPPPAPPRLGQEEVSGALEELLAGDGSRCRERLAGVDLPRLLAHRQRAVVARALLLDARCAEGLGNTAAAEARFKEFASYELELAEATAVLSPTLRARFDEALAWHGRAPRARVEVRGAPGGVLWVDGRAGACAVPCAPSLAVGAHVLAVEAEGVALAWRRIDVTGPTVLELPAAPATAQEAAEQWHARAGRGVAADDERSLRLLPLAISDERIAYVQARGAAEGLAGALVERRAGRIEVAARGRRARADQAPALVRQLAIDAGVIAAPRPRWFWPVLAGSVLATAALTTLIFYQPEIRTKVEL